MLGAVAFIGCASRTPVQQINLEELKKNLRYDHVIVGDFTKGANLAAVASADQAVSDCRNTLMEYLRGSEVYAHVSEAASASPVEGTPLRIDAVVQELRIVSGGARFWAGAWAGRSTMSVDVKLTDASNKVIAQQTVTGTPSSFGSAWSFGGADRGLPGRMGQLIGDYVLSNSGGGSAAP